MLVATAAAVPAAHVSAVVQLFTKVVIGWCLKQVLMSVDQSFVFVRCRSALHVSWMLMFLSVAGAMWWQWDMTNTPFVYDGGDLEVSYTDTTFQNVIEPSSAFLLSQAQTNVAQCVRRNQNTAPATGTATAGRRLLAA